MSNSYLILSVVVAICIHRSQSSSCNAYLPVESNPCLTKNCPFGAKCILDYDGLNAECVCEKKCYSYGDSVDSRPVCGSDGRDYQNICELNKLACELEKTISVRYNGSCDPCYGIKCPDLQICQIDDNRVPICKCQASCGDEFEPVCGNDGKTYINECTLRLEACRTRKGLRTRSQGRCPESSPCHSVKCTIYQECEIDDKLPMVAECRCPTTCSKILKPVCGTDGVTYDSECELRRHACLDRLNVTVRYHGACNSAAYCHQNHGICKHGAVCHSLDLDDYSCVCPECSEEYAPVCGNNGITYTNLCKFRRDSCEKKSTLITVREGTCYGCENKNCRFYSVCQKGNCVCPHHCDMSQDPVCGSDMMTYQNECHLRLKACQAQKYIIPIKHGSCTSCKDVQCDYGARCEDGACVCPRKCPHHFEPVCGSNNITYDNECKVMAASCESTTKIILKHKGTCEGYNVYDEYSALLSASEKNILAQRSQNQGESKRVMPDHSASSQRLCDYNICKYSGTCILDERDQPRCLCNFTCPYSKNKLCGNDGRLYDNQCQFRQEICSRQQEIKRKDFSFCRRKNSVACDGDAPIYDPSTGKEFNCHNATCPTESYCHKSHDFAKCCPDVDYDESCHEMPYGCCQDNQTPALGPSQAGCPENCNCNRFGAILQKCDPNTKRCYCKPKVTGKRCDRCEPGFWGLHKIGEGNFGCIPCKCNKVGSIRNDCEQMSGSCVCKPGYKGIKCDLCPDGSPIESYGCPMVSNTTCSDNSQCHFGSVCKNFICSCVNNCSSKTGLSVCGGDGNLYDSECHLKLWSCKAQKSIAVVSLDQCSSTKKTTAKNSATTSPVRRSTEYLTTKQFATDSDDEEDSFSSGTTVPTLTTVEWEIEHNRSPLFNGRAYVALKTLAAYSKMSLHLKFIPFESEGILLFNSQTNTGEGDYVALLLKNGFLEFRFNLGSGNVAIKSLEPLVLGKSVTVEVGRLLSEGYLLIDGHLNITGRSDGPHKLLDLGHHLFVGGTPHWNTKRLNDLFGTNKNFTGCLQNLDINSEEFDFEDDLRTSALESHHIDWCVRDSCSTVFCKTHGVCVSNVPEQFECECDDGFDGARCQQSSLTKSNGAGFTNDSIIDFWNDSYLQLPTLQGVSQMFNIEIWLMPRSPDGLVLYNGQSKGDFVQLALVDGRVQYSFNLGGEKGDVVQITSVEKIALGEWHRIVMGRKVKEGSLQIDDAPIIRASSKGTLNELNLDEPFFIGGIVVSDASSTNTTSSSPPVHQHPHLVKRGFNGALQRLIVNGVIHKQLLSKSSKKVNVQGYEGPPCGYDNPCFNGARCIAWLDDYLCECTPTFHGRRCEMQMSSQESDVVSTGLSPLLVPIIASESVQFEYSSTSTVNVVELKVRTSQSDGLVLWTSKHSAKLRDFLAFAIVDGYGEFSFNLGNQQQHDRDQQLQNTGILLSTVARTPVRINDTREHRLLITRHKQVGILQLDDRYLTSVVSESSATSLNSNGKISLGTHLKLPLGLPLAYYKPFRGCLLGLIIDGSRLDIENIPVPFVSDCAEV